MYKIRNQQTLTKEITKESRVNIRNVENARIAMTYYDTYVLIFIMY